MFILRSFSQVIKFVKIILKLKLFLKQEHCIF